MVKFACGSYGSGLKPFDLDRTLASFETRTGRIKTMKNFCVLLLALVALLVVLTGCAAFGGTGDCGCSDNTVACACSGGTADCPCCGDECSCPESAAGAASCACTTGSCECGTHECSCGNDCSCGAATGSLDACACPATPGASFKK